MSTPHCTICGCAAGVILGDGAPRCRICVWELTQAAKYYVDDARYQAKPVSVAERLRILGFGDSGGRTS